MPESTFAHGYALLIGVGETKNPKFSLPVTVQDMTALAKILVDPSLCGFVDDSEHIRLLFNEQATKAEILAGLTWLDTQSRNDPEATAIVFYSGHGALDTTELRYFLLPHDVNPDDIANSALAAEDFTEAVRQIAAKRLLVLIDACHAEGMATAKDAGTDLQSQALPNPLLSALKQGEGRAVFSSSRGKQQSWVRQDGTMSIFTYHLLEALHGAGNIAGDNVVRLSNLMNHLGKSVPESVKTQYQQQQIPFFDTASEDFPVAILRGGKGLPAGGWQAVEQKAQEAIRTVSVNVQGNQNVTAGGDIKDSTIITGNNNVVGSNNRVTRVQRIDTGGGPFVGGNLRVGGNFVGRDQNVGVGNSNPQIVDLDALFRPLFALASSGSIHQTIQLLKNEVAQGINANDERLAELITDLLSEMTTLPKSATIALLTSVLPKPIGPITKFVLKKATTS